MVVMVIQSRQVSKGGGKHKRKERLMRKEVGVGEGEEEKKVWGDGERIDRTSPVCSRHSL